MELELATCTQAALILHINLLNSVSSSSFMEFRFDFDLLVVYKHLSLL